MFIILLYLLFLFLYFLFVSPLKKKVNERFIEKESPKHYGSGLGITVPEIAFKPNTTAEDKLGLNIPEKIKNSNATNISQLFHDANNDKDNTLSFFKKPEQVTPNVGKRQLYENLSYNPKTEKKYIFSTGLPKIKDL
jgi:hypothetical protein